MPCLIASIQRHPSILSSSGLSIYGYQIVVQLLAYMSPAIVLGDLTKYSELLVENQGRPLRSLAVLWALGQCGLKVIGRMGIAPLYRR